MTKCAFFFSVREVSKNELVHVIVSCVLFLIGLMINTNCTEVESLPVAESIL